MLFVAFSLNVLELPQVSWCIYQNSHAIDHCATEYNTIESMKILNYIKKDSHYFNMP